MKHTLSIILTFVAINALSQADIKTTRETKFLDCECIAFAKFDVIPAGESVKLIEYSNDYYTAVYKGKKGYIYYPYLSDISALNGVPKKTEHKISVESCRLQQFKSKYGDVNGRRAFEGSPWIGMPSEIAIDLFGKPNAINITTIEGLKAEQWVYTSRNLYFDNGKLTAIQDSSGSR